MRVGTFILAILLICSPVWAQELTNLLPEVKIIEEKNLAPAGFYSEKLDSTALAESARNTLAELLTYRSHIYIKTYGVGGLATASFRGTGANHTKVYFKTLPINSALLGLTDLSLLPVSLSDAVEIYHGAGGLVLGAGGTGGSINLNTVPQSYPTKGVSLGYTEGSFSTRHAHAAVRYGTGKLYTVTKLFWKTAENDFSYVNTEKPGKPTERLENAQTNQQGILSEVYYTVKPRRRIGAGVWAQTGDRNIPPLMFTRNTGENQEDRALRTYAEYLHVGKKINFTAISGYFREVLIYRYPRSGYQAYTESNAMKSRATATGRWGKRIEWSTGIHHEYDAVTADGLPTAATRHLLSPTAGMVYTPKSQRWETSLRLRQEAYTGNTSLLLGAAGFSYKPVKDVEWIVRSGIYRDYRLPTLADLYRSPGGKPDLMPEMQIGAEIGTAYKYVPDSGLRNYTVSVNLYRAEANNLILWRPVSAGLWSPENLSRVSIMGAELNFRAQTKWRKWSILGEMSGDLTQSTNRDPILQNDNTVNKQVIYIPLWQSKGNVEIRHDKGWKGGWRRTATGPRFISTDNSEYLPFFSINDLLVAKSFKSKYFSYAELKLEVNNLFNSAYQNIAYRPMPGRHFMLSTMIVF